MKTETLNLRISPEAKMLLAAAAKLEHRSNSNLVEFLILNFCKEKGIGPEGVDSTFGQPEASKS